MLKQPVPSEGADPRDTSSSADGRAVAAGDSSRSNASALGVSVGRNPLEDSPMCPMFSDLPGQHSRLVLEALRSDGGSEFIKAVEDLVAVGGYDAAKALGLLLSEASREEGALASLAGDDRWSTVYTLCKALLRIAGDNRLLRFNDIEPCQQLSQPQKREVVALVKFLARGNHGDVQTATGARLLMLERWSQVPIVGQIFERCFEAFDAVDRFFSGRPQDYPSSFLFVLADLPWALWSRIPFASVESRRGILFEIISKR